MTATRSQEQSRLTPTAWVELQAIMERPVMLSPALRAAAEATRSAIATGHLVREPDVIVAPAPVHRDDALRWLDTYQEWHGRQRPSYRVHRHESSRPVDERGVFTDHESVWIAIRGRNGQSIQTDPGFRLEQWLAANAFIEARWPNEGSASVPAHLVAPVCEAIPYPTSFDDDDW